MDCWSLRVERQSGPPFCLVVIVVNDRTKTMTNYRFYTHYDRKIFKDLASVCLFVSGL